MQLPFAADNADLRGSLHKLGPTRMMALRSVSS